MKGRIDIQNQFISFQIRRSSIGGLFSVRLNESIQLPGIVLECLAKTCKEYATIASPTSEHITHIMRLNYGSKNLCDQ